MSNPTQNPDPYTTGPEYDPPQYGTTPGNEGTAAEVADPYASYASNVPYEPVDPNAPPAGTYASGGYIAVPDLGDGGGSPSTKDVAKDEAVQVKDTAVDAGRQVASTAKVEAANVAGEAKQQAASLLSSATSELKSQASTQQNKLAGTLKGYTDQLQGLSSGQGLEDGPLNDLVQQAASRGSEIVSWLEDREPADVLDELRRFGRRRPVLFLVLCGAAGVVAGRIARGAVAANTSVDSPKPDRSLETGYATPDAYTATDPYAVTDPYATPNPYVQTDTTYGAYTDAPVAGYPGDATLTGEEASVGYADRGDPIR